MSEGLPPASNGEPEAAPAPEPIPLALEGSTPGGIGAPGPIAPPPISTGPRKKWYVAARDWIHDYFFGEDPTLSTALVPLCFLSMLLFTRHPVKTNFIFDEQEALLANPYVRSVADPKSSLHWLDAFRRDFWGLPPDRSIGSYRPLPNLVWRALWAIGAREQTPFLHHWVNVLLHGVNGGLMVVLVMRLTKDRTMAWLAGAALVGCAVLTEAVSGVVGLADVLGTLGVLLALLSLTLRMPFMPFAVLGSTLLGLYSKESALCAVPLVPFAAVVWAPLLHPQKPRRALRGLLALVAAGAAFVFYVEARRRMFPTTLNPELSVEANAAKPWAGRTFAMLLRWYAQPMLPKDPLNNPLITANAPLRIAGALRVYWRGIVQVFVPYTLSGDYSAPQEPVPARVIFPESVLGALSLLGPPFAAIVLWVHSMMRERKLREVIAVQAAGGYGNGVARLAVHPLGPVISVALMWIVVSYFPVSNIPIVLPTVRAERFWYFPAIGTSILFAMVVAKLLAWARERGDKDRWGAYALIAAFFVFQGVAARRHANDYTDDLVFWDATRKAVPRSAKAHLNYSVMKGARGDLNARLEANKTALDLAPDWPMASVYLGDTLCRLHRAPEAWPYYKRGFTLGPNDQSLIALGMQCLWDEQQLLQTSDLWIDLSDIGGKAPGTWLDFLQADVRANGEKNSGVDPKYRPRGYNEGPKNE
jgi:hypothetical protein